MTAINMAIARFDDDTKEGFLNLYTKVDGDAPVEAEAPVDWNAIDADARVDLAVPYDDKTDAKAAGCKWDGDRKVWYTTAAAIASNPSAFEVWNPQAPADIECPF